ncbi:MAG: hypothetical protein Q8R29_00710, partial [bacterium]|nr:hypothetical protein [bacterium]
MDLSKFVEQKKQEKKEIAEAERIRITAEHEEEMRKEAEARVREDVLHQLADFEKQEEIKRKIGALEQEKKDILDSLAGWKTGREEMVSAAKATREKRRGLKKTVEEGKEFFAEEGVKDVKGLLKSEKFAGAGEVQSYQEAEKALLEKVKELKGHRRKATDQERGHLSKAEKEIAKKIEKINKEIQELHEQTPEGQLEIKKSAVKEIQERHGKLNRYVLDKHDGLHATNFVTQEDLKLIPKAGEGLVRETILKHYLAQLDKQLKEDNSDVFVLDKELRQMEKLPERMEEANRALEKLEKAQREAEASMRKNLEDKGDIEKVGITGSLLEEERVQKAIQNYVDSYLVNLVVSRRRNTDEHTPELKELLRAKYNQRLLQDFKTYSGKDPSRILNLYRGKEIDTRQE